MGKRLSYSLVMENINAARCHYAYPNSYGHECEAPASFVRPLRSDLTVSGVYFAHRCEKHKALKDGNGENALVGSIQPISVEHVNVWR